MRKIGEFSSMHSLRKRTNIFIWHPIIVFCFSTFCRFIADSEHRVDFNQKCTYPTIIAQRWLGIRLEIVGALVIFFAALFAVLARGDITGGSVGLSISYALQITMVLSFLVRTTAEG